MDTMNTPSPADAVLAVLPRSTDECWETVELHDWLRTVCPDLRLTLDDVEEVVTGMAKDGTVETSEIDGEPGAMTVGLTQAGLAAAAALPPAVIDATRKPPYAHPYTGIVNWRVAAALRRLEGAKPDDAAFTAGMALGLADGLYAAGGIGDSEWKSANLHVQHLYRARNNTSAT